MVTPPTATTGRPISSGPGEVADDRRDGVARTGRGYPLVPPLVRVAILIPCGRAPHVFPVDVGDRRLAPAPALFEQPRGRLAARRRDGDRPRDLHWPAPAATSPSMSPQEPSRRSTR